MKSYETDESEKEWKKWESGQWDCGTCVKKCILYLTKAQVLLKEIRLLRDRMKEVAMKLYRQKDDLY